MKKERQDALGQVGARVGKGTDGAYRWLHETNLYRTPTFLFLMWRIFFFIWLGIALFIMILAAFEGHLTRSLQDLALPMLYVLLFLLFLVTFSYYVYALLMGGKYSVLFTMDEKGVSHTQLPRQFKRARKIAAASLLLGLATGNPGAAGAGLLAASRQSMRSEFKKVRAVKANRRTRTVKLRSSDLMHNQVYTAPEDYDFVLGFIRDRTANARFRSADSPRT